MNAPGNDPSDLFKVGLSVTYTYRWRGERFTTRATFERKSRIPGLGIIRVDLGTDGFYYKRVRLSRLKPVSIVMAGGGS